MASSKERILQAGSTLFRRQGYYGTGVKRIVAEANAPFASLYHFFPGGKAELGEQVIRASGARYLELIDACLGTPEEPAPDLPAAVAGFFELAATTMAETDYADACPIATVALEVASTDEPLRMATADVFDSWLAAAAERLRAAGVPASAADDLATTLFCLLEGAFILCRSKRSPQPLWQAGATAVLATKEALSK